MAHRTAIGSGSTNNNGGVAYGVGATTDGPVTNIAIATSSVGGSQILNSVPYPTQKNGVSSAFQTAAVALTSVANNGSSKCRFTKTSHGLSVGAVIFVTGSTDGNIDATHTITAVPTSGTFDTDVAYVASASAGSYRQVDRNFGKLVPGDYAVKLVGTKLAGTADSTITSPGGFGASKTGLYYGRGNRRIDFTAFDVYSGTATYGSNRGDLFTYKKATDGTALAHEAFPTSAIPGGLVYKYGAALPTNDQYKATTSP